MSGLQEGTTNFKIFLFLDTLKPRFSSILINSLFSTLNPVVFSKRNGSKFIMEIIFELVWQFDFKVLIYLVASIGTVTLILIMLTNLKYLSPKVYPLIRNQ